MKLAPLALVLAACNSGSATPQRRAVGSAAVRAAQADTRGAIELYTKFCAQCHGADAKGYKSDHAPSLVSPTFLASATDDFLRRSIEFGRPGTAMAGYGKVIGGPLDSFAVSRLVAWLRDQGSPAERLPTTLLAGDAKHGAEVYGVNCLKCHGDQTTRGDGVFLANSRFLEAASDAFMRYAIVHGRPGTPMIAWEGKLTDRDIDDVVAYVRGFGKPPPVASLPAPTGTEPLFVNPKGKPPSFTPHAEPGQTDARFVPADQVKQAYDAGRKMIIIDARPAPEWMHVHITGAVSIPYHDLKRLDEIPKDAWVVAYCACPHHLSGIVVDELRKRGYTHAFVLDEGILEWQRRNYPIIAAAGVTMPPKEAGSAAPLPLLPSTPFH